MPRLPLPRLTDAVVALALALAASPALALVPRHEEDLDGRVVPPTYFDQIAEEEDAAGPGAAAAAEFRRRWPGEWRITFDRRTGRPSLVEGRGIPFLPGSGNGLPAAGPDPPGRPGGLDDVAPLGRAFIAREAALLEPPAGDLVLSPDRSAFLENGDIVFLDYDWVVDGVPVEGARVFLRVNHGNIIQFGSARVGAGIPSTRPILEAGQALDRLFEHAGGRRASDDVVEPPRLLFLTLPRGRSDVPWAGGVTYRLAWRAAFRRVGEVMTWTGDVDARTGEILAFADANRYARVVGGVYPRTVSDPEQNRPFANLHVFSSPASFDTGGAGTFVYAGGPAFTSLDGTYFRTTCAGCDAPERAFAFVSSGTGDLDLGTGGVDEIGNGASTPAERNAFFHQNRVRSLALKWLGIGWLNTTVQTNVNIADVCNAFWNGATNFFRSGGGCNNTGEIADVMYHEWGHGLDQNTNPGDGSTGEATGDIISMHVTHDALLGPSFGVNGDPVRNLDSDSVGYVLSPANLNGNCIVCVPGQCTNGPYGHEVHCEGEIYGQAQWDLAQALAAKHGYNTGWQALERITFLSLPQNDTMVPAQSQSAYSAYLAVDDDNGNLADGTPNCLQIYNAFNAHGIAGAACAGTTAGCARPAQPAVTATPGTGRVILDWTASAGASTYTVLRADFSPALAYFPLGSVSGTHFEDLTAQPGLTYYYVLEAQTASGCRSTIENAVGASPLPDARLTLVAPILSDVPAGNRSGFADPGESIDLTLPLLNHVPAGAAPAAQGTLSTATPDVTVTTASASYGAIAPGASASGTAYRAALGSGLACGQDIAFTAALSDGGSAPPATAYVPILVGARSTVRYVQSFEGANDWTTVNGGPPATAGAWIVGDPVGTNWQPNQDATPAPGSRCLFTGQNSSDTTGDVDGGETIALSPFIDLSGASAARLSYRRWWAAFPPTDPNDSLVVEVSSNGGASWVAAESVPAAASNLGWQPMDFRLESLIPLTSTFRMRVRARDGSPPETTVEAAIDDIRVEEVVCDLTPPCFVAPTFAGLATAAPGASCGETNLAWSPASTNCQNAQISYSVYRSLTPGFVPDDGNRIAAGLTGTSFHDTLLQPGATYHYVVRADDSRSGQDANTVVRAAVATLSPDTVPPVFSGLLSAGTGLACGETVLQWLPAGETCSGPPHYDIYRSTSPGFAPGPASHVASVLGTTYVDTALVPGQTYYYKARAADSAGNEDGNLLERAAPALILPLVLHSLDFESGAGGWATIAPNDAVSGTWELGDPQGTGVQPEDDATPAPGVNAWITGLQAGSGAGSFDVDGGTTTLASPPINLTGQTGPVLRMSLFFSNSQGSLPGEDPLLVDVSGNGGANWVNALTTFADIAPWTVRQFPLAGLVPLNDQFRIRVQTQDLGAGGSLVEAGVDDVSVLQPDAGCSVCPLPVGGVGTIMVTRSGDDVVIDWSGDPVAAASYNVYLRSGPALATFRRAGSTTAKSFVHAGAALLLGDNFVYQVTAVDACGQESPVP